MRHLTLASLLILATCNNPAALSAVGAGYYQPRYAPAYVPPPPRNTTCYPVGATLQCHQW